MNNLYQTTHSPRGANANFSFGLECGGGGFAVEKDRVSEQDVFIGYREGKVLKCLPFLSKQKRNDFASFNIEDYPNDEFVRFSAFQKEEIHRENLYASDIFQAGKVKFEMITPVGGINLNEDLKYQIMPGLLAEITFDNSEGTEEIEGVFAVGPDRSREFIDDDNMLGFYMANGYGFCTSKQEGVYFRTAHEVFAAFGTNYQKWYYPTVNCLIFKVNPGEKKTYHIAFGFYKDTKTLGAKKMKYYYTNFYHDIIDVLKYCLQNASKIYNEAQKNNEILKNSGLNKYRQTILAQAMKSYFASTMLFDNNGKMEWLVNEGSFQMINTLDLAVDHLFFELETQPWSVKSQLDTYMDDYSYEDTVHMAGDTKSYPGGISFCHDMGMYQVFTPKGTSSYETTHLRGVFSYMTQEQLCNIILCTALYVEKTRDFTWLHGRRELVEKMYQSMLNRDHYEESKRDGIQDMETDKVESGFEATTYDNLDPSLVSAARGLYIAVKCFSSYYSLHKLFEFLGNGEKAEKAMESAKLCARTVISYYDEEKGYIPAVLKRDQEYAAIIPAIEGLIYPAYLSGTQVYGEGEFADLFNTLKKHFQNIFRKGCCQKEDGSWYLSSSSTIKFASKTFLNQFIAEKIFNIEFEDIEEQDKAHLRDWVEVHPSCPSLDQTQETAEKNFHYPRAITSYLWLVGEKNLCEKDRYLYK